MHCGPVFALGLVLAALLPQPGFSQTAAPLTGAEAFAADWQASSPGVKWFIRPRDLPRPYASESASNGPANVLWREGMIPKAPPGFKVELFAKGLDQPRTIRIAPNGDVFVVESSAGRIRVFRSGDAAGAAPSVFALRLTAPYGLAFYPPSDPKYVYVAETNRIVRYPYAVGSQRASGAAEVVIAKLPSGGHWTRDIAFSADGKQMFIAIGSLSNAGEGLPRSGLAEIKAFEERNGIGAAWAGEEGRAGLFVADPDGKNLRPFATGIRNCSGLAINPSTTAPWCATNERDGLGDNLPTDYVTEVRKGGFYGWPWFYIGGNPDPRHAANPRQELRPLALTPDILIQAHSAPLGLAFYYGKMFPDFVGDAFVALHGSWNRGKRTGYKLVRLLFEKGRPTGVYEDFLTGFIVNADSVWGRPVGVAVAADGAILVSEDEAGTIWRISKQ